MRLVRVLIWNTIVGLVTLFFANLVWPGQIGYPWWGVLLTAVGGVPGAILTILLELLVLQG